MREALRSALEKAVAKQQSTTLMLDLLNHRVRNNLAIITLMLELQARSQKELAVEDAFVSAVGRVRPSGAASTSPPRTGLQLRPHSQIQPSHSRVHSQTPSQALRLGVYWLSLAHNSWEWRLRWLWGAGYGLIRGLYARDGAAGSAIFVQRCHADPCTIARVLAGRILIVSDSKFCRFGSASMAACPSRRQSTDSS
jgi:hypothetical protein